MSTTAPTRLRVRPAPRCDPPYDDERSEPLAPAQTSRNHAQGRLGLRFVLPSGLPVDPTPPPRLRLITNDDDFAYRYSTRSELPDPRAWAARFVQAALEVTTGGRPVLQLLRWATTEVYDDLRHRAVAASHGDVGIRRHRAPWIVRSLHVSEPLDGVVEACAVVERGARLRALALRLEGLDGRWVCTVLDWG
jgi:hypothetical protein